MRPIALDTVNGAAAASFIGATVAGWDVQEWAAAAALIYSLLLIADKGWTMTQRWKAGRGQ